MEIFSSLDAQFADIGPLLLYFIVGANVFVQSALVVGFVLPGSSILFSAGLVAATEENVSISALLTVIFMAAFIGNQVGFVIGRVLGRSYLSKRKSPALQKVIRKCESFYEKSGWWSVVAARFVPWVRTFLPLIAGASKMPYYQFLSANILGALAWGVGITLAGYYTASIPGVETFTYAIAGFFILGSIISGIVDYLRRRRLLQDKS
jgi:membrane-associated protein